MHIIAGSLRRRRLHAPKGLQTRPTSGRVREAMFNILESRISLEGAAVLDLFAGIGSLGLEALSRGAASAVFVEHRPAVLQMARRNAAECGVSSVSRFRCIDAWTYLQRYHGPPLDVVLADPPYGLEEAEDLPARITPILAPNGLFVLEHDHRWRYEAHPNLVLCRAYGRTMVSVFDHSRE